MVGQIYLQGSSTDISTMAAGLEEDNLSQMIRDYVELGSRTTTSYSPSSQVPEDDYQPTFVSLKEILENVSDAENEVFGKILLYLRDMEAKKLRKWIVKKLAMDCYEACLCRTSWITTFGRSSGDYEYIDVMMKNGDDGEAVRLIVDIDFRSQFELARPTPAYQELSNSLPRVFVGTEEKLVKIITLVCSAAKQSLKESGLHVPPWRKATYMQSKWLSMDCKKIPSSELDAPADAPPKKDLRRISALHKYEATTGKSTAFVSSQVSRWKPAAFVKQHW